MPKKTKVSFNLHTLISHRKQYQEHLLIVCLLIVSRLSRGKDCHFVPEKRLKEISIFMRNGQNGVNVPLQSAKLEE